MKVAHQRDSVALLADRFVRLHPVIRAHHPVNVPVTVAQQKRRTEKRDQTAAVGPLPPPAAALCKPQQGVYQVQAYCKAKQVHHHHGPGIPHLEHLKGAHRPQGCGPHPGRPVRRLFPPPGDCAFEIEVKIDADRRRSSQKRAKKHCSHCPSPSSRGSLRLTLRPQTAPPPGAYSPAPAPGTGSGSHRPRRRCTRTPCAPTPDSVPGRFPAYVPGPCRDLRILSP